MFWIYLNPRPGQNCMSIIVLELVLLLVVTFVRPRTNAVVDPWPSVVCVNCTYTTNDLTMSLSQTKNTLLCGRITFHKHMAILCLNHAVLQVSVSSSGLVDYIAWWEITSSGYSRVGIRAAKLSIVGLLDIFDSLKKYYYSFPLEIFFFV